MKDTELKRIAKMIDGHLEKINDLVKRINNSDREDKDEILSVLDSNLIGVIPCAIASLSEYYSKYD